MQKYNWNSVVEHQSVGHQPVVKCSMITSRTNNTLLWIEALLKNYCEDPEIEEKFHDPRRVVKVTWIDIFCVLAIYISPVTTVLSHNMNLFIVIHLSWKLSDMCHCVVHICTPTVRLAQQQQPQQQQPRSQKTRPFLIELSQGKSTWISCIRKTISHTLDDEENRKRRKKNSNAQSYKSDYRSTAVVHQQRQVWDARFHLHIHTYTPEIP